MGFFKKFFGFNYEKLTYKEALEVLQKDSSYTFIPRGDGFYKAVIPEKNAESLKRKCDFGKRYEYPLQQYTSPRIASLNKPNINPKQKADFSR